MYDLDPENPETEKWHCYFKCLKNPSKHKKDFDFFLKEIMLSKVLIK